MSVKIKLRYEYEADLISEEVHVKLRKGRDAKGDFYIRRDYLNLITGHNQALLFRVDEETYRKTLLDDEDWWKWKSFSC